MSFRLRAAHPDDLEPLYEMAKLTGGGFTNLPPDRNALRAKLERTEAAFTREENTLADEQFVLVLENAQTGDVRGTCQLMTQVGQRWPFYSYRKTTLTQHSQELERTVRADLLSLVTDLEGSCEVGGLFLHPSERAGGLGLLLARSRYLFIAMHRDRFADRILAELRGIIDERGGSPFWDGVAGRFFGMSFQDADYFNAINGNQFIADLMPKHPVYIAMLDDDARDVIGMPHPTGRAAMRMLENEGFRYDGYVDIFDGGPTMTARTDDVKSIRESRRAKIASASLDIGDRAIIAAGTLGSFRSAFGMREFRPDGTVEIDHRSARLLGVGEGDEVWSVAR
ncbi:arginine N-succinyltransferase [Tsuneonella sp. YG55]|uniref:Arginine N-succinyltransferase n=1 Tax=Tsuneonella litorea TaxID=2976475 RepID=A0A9X3A904_9SPHN|nr:arginine N-succinyltransferase [Tsuneonella litorea]MCT2558390.1 arginine N-succinyltransferase [Tsuneonella litorea]